MFRTVIIILSVILIIIGCQSEKGFEIKKFQALINYQPGKLEKNINMDYSTAIDSGFTIPSASQVASGYFKFSFSIKNDTEHSQFVYKIFYQNETYKESEEVYGEYNPLSGFNFYGSWEATSDSMREIEVSGGSEIALTDSFRIIGNPRNESIYFGKDPRPVTLAEIQHIIDHIRGDAKWFASIKSKAEKENRSIDEQLEMDAMYIANEERGKVITNNRWKRNPRTGIYKFYLVVSPKSSMSEVPDYVWNLNIASDDGIYINPLYFLKNSAADKKNIRVIEFKEELMVSASPDLGSGIYINPRVKKSENSNKLFYNSRCNESISLYRQAPFEQYFHHLPEKFYSPNIPVIEDVQSDSFTPAIYNYYLQEYKKERLLQYSNIASLCPCENVYSDSIQKKVVIKNPGFRRGLNVKENTGIISRNGLTYGKYTFKVKMPRLLNRKHVWNGLTNALWLINQSNEAWNTRRACNGSGYIPKEIHGDENAARSRQVSYTEIDFEIRKGHPLWPATSYTKDFPRPSYNNNDSGEITVLCTNWDLACDEPKDFNAGARIFKNKGKEYVLHRWTHWYQALSSKYPAADEELFGGEYYFFQIEWKPASITWRIGPEKDKLREICYMDKSVTSIPDNQMLMVLTQEYHISEWWPESPYLQEYIPIPKNDIIGEILNIEIE
jgi:hypothetical protein